MIPGEAYQYERIRFAVDGSVARITLDHGAQNIIDFAMMDDLRQARLELERSREISVVLIEGNGDNFSAGVDIPSHTPDRVQTMLGRFHSVIRLMSQSSRVLVAAVRGNCLGGGAELALMCDIVYTDVNARWGFPEIKLGCFPPVACAVLGAVVGQKRAAELVLTGRNFDGKQAAEYGIANEALSGSELSARLDRTVQELSELSPSSLKITKRALYSWKAAHLDKALAAAEEMYLNELAATGDMNEGIRAWMEKRPPKWSGK